MWRITYFIHLNNENIIIFNSKNKMDINIEIYF